MTKFSSTLPKGEANGLTSIHNQLLANPKGTHLIVGVVDVKTITTDVDTGDQVATVRFRRVEPIAPQDADEAVRLMQRGTERRTGATMLPIEIEDELRELMANLDFSTGELTDDEIRDGIADPAEGPGDDEPGQAPPAVAPDETPDRPGRADPAEGPANDQPPTLDDDPEPTQPQEPVKDPAPAAEPAPEPEAPKKRGRGRPRKVKEEPAPAPAPAPAAPEDLAAATVPAAPWDTFTEVPEPETKED